MTLLFSRLKPVVGLINVAALPGTPRNTESLALSDNVRNKELLAWAFAMAGGRTEAISILNNLKNQFRQPIESLSLARSTTPSGKKMWHWRIWKRLMKDAMTVFCGLKLTRRSKAYAQNRAFNICCGALACLSNR